MNFKPSRSFAIEKLNKFVDQDLVNYSKLRNFDYGPNKRSNVSCLSPYIAHGVINELEIIRKSLKKFSFIKNEKFIQEVLWRTYWKGWLELRPNVWTDYLIELKQEPIEEEIARVDLEDLYLYFDPITSFINILNGENEAKTIDGRRIYTLKQYKSEDGNIILEIEDYVNIWADHKRNDLKKIEFLVKDDLLPYEILIHFKKRVFKLERI